MSIDIEFDNYPTLTWSGIIAILYAARIAINYYFKFWLFYIPST